MTPCGFLKHSNASEQFIELHSTVKPEVLIIINVNNISTSTPWTSKIR